MTPRSSGPTSAVAARIDVELAARLRQEADARMVSERVVLEAALRFFFDCLDDGEVPSWQPVPHLPGGTVPRGWRVVDGRAVPPA